MHLDQLCVGPGDGVARVPGTRRLRIQPEPAAGTGEDPGLPDVAWLRVPSPSAGSGPADDALLMFPYIACAQMYAFFRSLELGRRPDAPNDSGVVNRVVRGVTLHGLG